MTLQLIMNHSFVDIVEILTLKVTKFFKNCLLKLPTDWQ